MGVLQDLLLTMQAEYHEVRLRLPRPDPDSATLWHRPARATELLEILMSWVIAEHDTDGPGCVSMTYELLSWSCICSASMQRRGASAHYFPGGTRGRHGEGEA